MGKSLSKTCIKTIWGECEAPEKVRYAYKLQNSDIQDKEVVSQKMIDIEKGIDTK